ncbi:hypothetical protein AB0M39_19790 [Streptomyces sp. NPDC051907]|uniref:hypothetical protein n=1 Tax=Streptomyces sp. NPDC051907 TaxID=3155284 RepID=UPI003424835F
MSPADVHIGVESRLIDDYYRFSQRETVGPAQIETGVTRSFRSLEGLVDGLLASSESTHVVVCHGNPDLGLLVPFTQNSPHNATGLLAGALVDLVNAMAHGTLPPFPPDPRLLDAGARMGVDTATVLRLLGKLLLLRTTPPLRRVIHFRACNFGRRTSMLAGYKLLFDAALVTGPTCRMLYVEVLPGPPRPGASIQQLGGQAPTTQRTRRRVFGPASDGTAGPLLLDVRDLDTHTHVDTPLSLLDHPAQAPRWGELLTGRWTNHTANRFVLPLLWQNDESSYHCPLEERYREHFLHV